MRDGALGRPAPPARPCDCGRSSPVRLSVQGSTPTGLGAQVRYSTGMSDRRSSESSNIDSPHSAKLHPRQHAISESYRCH